MTEQGKMRRFYSTEFKVLGQEEQYPPRFHVVYKDIDEDGRVVGTGMVREKGEGITLFKCKEDSDRLARICAESYGGAFVEC